MARPRRNCGGTSPTTSYGSRVRGSGTRRRPSPTRRMRRSTHSTASVVVRPAAAIPGSTTATTCWRLLVVMTERKAIDQAQRERRQRRGAGKVLGTLDGTIADRWGGGVLGRWAPSRLPSSPRWWSTNAADLFAMLRDETLREVARLKMEGYTSEEVAERLGCSLRSVARKLELIRRTWHAGRGSNHER